MIINQIFWIILITIFIGTLIYYFGEVLHTFYREIIKFAGGIITFGTLILSFFILNWETALLLIVLEFTAVSFASAFIVEFLTNKRIKSGV